MITRTFLAVALLAGVFLTGCSKPPAPVEVEPTPPPVVVATPPPATPEPATPAPVATPPPKRLAPAGTFFLLRPKSIETADGIVGLKPGTLVQQQPDGTFLADGQKVEVTETELTNDLDLAARILGADARAQAAIRQTLAAAPAATPRPATPAPEAARAAPNSTTARPTEPKMTGGTRGGQGAVQSSTGLGSGHTMTKDGWLYQKNTDGEWIKVRPLRNP